MIDGRKTDLCQQYSRILYLLATVDLEQLLSLFLPVSLGVMG